MKAKIDNPAFSPEVARAGREGIALRDIQGFLRHRSETAPTTGLKEYNMQTMVGALRIAYRAFGEINPLITRYPTKRLDSTGEVQRIREEILPEEAFVYLEYGKIGLTQGEETTLRKEGDRHIHKITKDDYHSISASAFLVPGSKDTFTVMIDGQLVEAEPSSINTNFGVELMAKIKKTRPRWVYKTI